MRRLFGASKPKQPAPTLGEMCDNLDKRAGSLDDKIKKLDTELVQIREQINKTKSPAIKNQLKQKAMRLLKQKKMYENQRDQVMGQQFNLTQADLARESMQATVTTVAAMKEANSTMKNQFKEIKIDDIENIYDEMEDLLEQSNEISDTLARSFSLPFDVDESELDDELAALGDEIYEDESVAESGAVPSYLSALPSAQSELPSASGATLPSTPQTITTS
eukprot:TRINITY_DN5175_c0_g1_i1.p1 TRINITY_DN5175_c0_g1~~TRINITY_DN5175_c0_g1_i1.p1  ORF type:complete len:240 (+),score=81.94 TRINITY_DN5175_c0_g1_i1:62-721(+)